MHNKADHNNLQATSPLASCQESYYLSVQGLEGSLSIPLKDVIAKMQKGKAMPSVFWIHGNSTTTTLTEWTLYYTESMVCPLCILLTNLVHSIEQSLIIRTKKLNGEYITNQINLSEIYHVRAVHECWHNKAPGKVRNLGCRTHVVICHS